MIESKKEVKKSLKKEVTPFRQRKDETWEFYFVEAGTEDRFGFDKETIERCSFEKIFEEDKDETKKFKEDTIVIIYKYKDGNGIETITKIPYNVCIKYKYLSDIKKNKFLKPLHNEFEFSVKAKYDFIKLIIDNYTLIGAIETGNMERVKKLLNEDNEIHNYINEKDDEGNTPLHYAIYYDNLELIELLLKQKNIKVNAKNEKGFAPLHIVILGNSINSLNILEYLLDNGANINVQDKNGHTPLHVAISQNDIEVIEMLLERRIKINTQTKVGNTAMHYAVSTNYVSIVETLLDDKYKYNVDINKLNIYNLTPLDIAIKNKNKSIIELLQDYNNKNNNSKSIKSINNSNNSNSNSKRRKIY